MIQRKRGAPIKYKICQQCDKKFWGYGQKYCSHGCAMESRVKYPKYRTCQQCSKEFWGKGMQKFCSLNCFGKSRVKLKEDKFCQQCGAKILGGGQKFCDIICSGKFHTGKNNPMYGKKNLGYTGRKHTGEFKKAMAGNKRGVGYKHTEETRAKIFGKNHPMYGKAHTEESKRKISLANIGPKNSSWKGGISFEPYCSAWVDEEYKEDIRARDGYKCQGVDCRGNSFHLALEIHHIDYDKKNCHPSNLITLCKSCNARANFNRQWWQGMYVQVMEGVI